MHEFYCDVKAKKNLVPSAKHRKNGSRSRRCSLPSDRMTNKQWIERNGPVMTYNLNKPMTWEQFTNPDLSNSAREDYLNSLIERFSMNQKTFAEMFGVSVATMARAVKKFDLNIQFVKGKFPNAEQRAEFERFLNTDLVDEVEIEECADEPNQPEVDVVAEQVEEPAEDESQKKISSMRMREVTLRFEGVLDIDAIANSLKMILGNNTGGEIEIICKIH